MKHIMYYYQISKLDILQDMNLIYKYQFQYHGNSFLNTHNLKDLSFYVHPQYTYYNL